MEINERLKELRNSKKLSMQELTDKVSMNFSTYQNYESGKRIPTADALMKLADFYGVTTDYLLGRNPQKETSLRAFAKAADLKELEEILVKEYLELTDKQREKVLDFLRRCIEQEVRRRGEPVGL